jgi:hypothetical protein
MYALIHVVALCMEIGFVRLLLVFGQHIRDGTNHSAVRETIIIKEI